MTTERLCAICGFNLRSDLFADVTGEKCCAICKVRFIGGLPTSDDLIMMARRELQLADGVYLTQDRGVEAKRIFGH